MAAWPRARSSRRRSGWPRSGSGVPVLPNADDRFHGRCSRIGAGSLPPPPAGQRCCVGTASSWPGVGPIHTVDPAGRRLGVRYASSSCGWRRRIPRGAIAGSRVSWWAWAIRTPSAPVHCLVSRAIDAADRPAEPSKPSRAGTKWPVDRPCTYNSRNTSATFGDLRHHGGRITDRNRLRAPVFGSTRLSLTRGVRSCTALAAVITSRGCACPLRTTRRRPRSSRSLANSARYASTPPPVRRPTSAALPSAPRRPAARRPHAATRSRRPPPGPGVPSRPTRQRRPCSRPRRSSGRYALPDLIHRSQAFLLGLRPSQGAICGRAVSAL
jgi:hypothetical protein